MRCLPILVLLGCSGGSRDPVSVRPDDAASQDAVPTDGREESAGREGDGTERPDGSGVGVGICMGACRSDDDCGQGRVCRPPRYSYLTCRSPDDVAPAALTYAQIKFRQPGACQRDDECAVNQACSFGRDVRMCEVACVEDSNCGDNQLCVDGRCEACRPPAVGCAGSTTCSEAGGLPDYGACFGTCTTNSECIAGGVWTQTLCTSR